MQRRSFLAGIFAAGIAPYIVTTAGVLMPHGKILTLSDLAMEEWTPNPYGEITLDLWDKITLEVPKKKRRLHDYWIATEETKFSGTLKGMPGIIEHGIFVPAKVESINYDSEKTVMMHRQDKKRNFTNFHI